MNSPVGMLSSPTVGTVRVACVDMVWVILGDTVGSFILTNFTAYKEASTRHLPGFVLFVLCSMHGRIPSPSASAWGTCLVPGTSQTPEAPRACFDLA
jgi:hypothetical protein